VIIGSQGSWRTKKRLIYSLDHAEYWLVNYRLTHGGRNQTNQSYTRNVNAVIPGVTTNDIDKV